MRILLADDNELIRRGVRSILASEVDWEICSEAVNGAEALRLGRELNPDVILLDVSMPGMSGLEAARLLRQDLPEVKIIMMSQHDPVQLFQSAIGAGADGCVDKSRLATDLLPAIQKANRTSAPPKGGQAGE